MSILAYDLGTGGVKASLYNDSLETIHKTFFEYQTYYPQANRHEQRPMDWWAGIAASTKKLLGETGVPASDIRCIAISGHSLVSIPIDRHGKLLLEQVPIWSDTRAVEEADEFFQKINNTEWYMTTGNGFPAPCYSLFKIMWYKKHLPDVYKQTDKFLGSKDYINYLLTGQIFTDYSYASGTGAYDLIGRQMRQEYLDAAGVSASLFPEIVQSHCIIGTVTEEAAAFTGLMAGTPVACGGVDNACMALGAIGTENGKIYTSLGSSSWVPVNSDKPVLDPVKKPYVFAHIDEAMFTSAFSIFAGGSSFRWIRDTLCKDITGPGAYDKLTALAATSPIGANGVFFNPSLAGGTSQDKSKNIQGAFVGLTLKTTREDLIRAAMEGIALNLKMSIGYLKQHTYVSDEILFCGGGSKSDFWMQMFADIFNMKIIKTNIDQDAASVGAAAVCARALSLWEDYSGIAKLHHIEKVFHPNKSHVEKYAHLGVIFEHICDVAADLGDYMYCNLRPL